MIDFEITTKPPVIAAPVVMRPSIPVGDARPTPIGSVPLSFDKPTVSVVIASLNETADLEATVALLAASSRPPDELVIVDDGTREPIEPRLASFRRHVNIRIIRNERRLGSGPAKSIGLAACTSDLLCVMDSHVRPPWDWIDSATDAFRRWPYSVMCPHSKGFESKSSFAGLGCNFQWDEHGWLDCKWIQWKQVPANGAIIPCIHGGCYLFGRKLLEHLGGYAPAQSGWGHEEIPLSLRAWIAGFDVRLLDFDLAHHYRQKNQPLDRTDANGRAPDPWEAWLNRHVSQAIVMPDLYERVLRPIMQGHFWPDGLRDAVAAAEPGIMAARAHLASIRVRSDDEVARLAGFRIPTSAIHYKALWAKGK